MPNDPVEAVELLAGGIDAADFRPIGLGQVNGRFFCFHTGVGFDAAVVAAGRAARLTEAVARPPAVHQRRGHHLAHRLRPPHPALPASPATAARRSTTATSRSCSTRTRTRTSATARSTCRRRPPSTNPLVAITFTTMSATAILSSLAGALRGGGVKPAAHLDIREDVRRLVSNTTTPFPYQVDGDALGDTRRLEFDYVPDAVSLVFPTLPDATDVRRQADRRQVASPSCAPGVRSVGGATGSRPSASGDGGHVGAHAVDAERRQLDEALGVVRTSTRSPAARRHDSARRRGRVDDPLPRMDRGVPGGRDPFDAPRRRASCTASRGMSAAIAAAGVRSWPTRTTRSASARTIARPRRRSSSIVRAGDRHRSRRTRRRRPGS